MGTEETRKRIGDAFAAWAKGDTKPFFALVADDVTWTVIGTTPISGRYESKRAFLKGAFGRLGPRLEGVPTLQDRQRPGGRRPRRCCSGRAPTSSITGQALPADLLLGHAAAGRADRRGDRLPRHRARVRHVRGLSVREHRRSDRTTTGGMT